MSARVPSCREARCCALASSRDNASLAESKPSDPAARRASGPGDGAAARVVVVPAMSSARP
eukprot:scaffold652_cov100-Isochrysis_galbana.AAC.3